MEVKLCCTRENLEAKILQIQGRKIFISMEIILRMGETGKSKRIKFQKTNKLNLMKSTILLILLRI